MDLSRVPMRYRVMISSNDTYASFGSSGWTRLPDWVEDLTEITTLILTRNYLTELPDWIGNLNNLESIELSHNRLTGIPESIGNLRNLRTLDLRFNRLTDLPRSLADLQLDRLDLRLYENPLEDPLPRLIARGPGELSAYLRSLDDAVRQYEAKMLLVGEGNVGKSSLVAAMLNLPFVDGRPTTHGIEISAIPFKHPDLDLDLTLRAWDFGGQEVYRVSHQFFFSPRAIYLVVWHARQGQEQDQVEDWVRRIRLRVGENAVILVVATHSRDRMPDLDYPHLARRFPGILGGAFEIDSSTGEGISRLRTAIAEQAAKLPVMGQRVSPRWEAAREAILAMSGFEPQIEYRRFTEVCAGHGLAADEASTLAKWMHDLGLIIYYDEDDGLKDIVVLNPEWLTRAISYVLDDRETADAGGVLQHGRLRAIWSERPAGGYAAKYHPYFLRLMEKFDVSYRFDGEESLSLIPQLVPHQRPALPWEPGDIPRDGSRTLALTCRLDEPAPGLIPWLTARHHHAATGRHWRRGVFLRHPIGAYRSEALIELPRDDELTLTVRAPSPDLYFNVLRDSVENLITRRWPGLGYKIYIPCPGAGADGWPCPGQFRLDGLLRVREAGKVSAVPCMDCGNLQEIAAVLTGFGSAEQPIRAELGQLHGQLGELATDVKGLRAQAADVAWAVRRVNQVVSAEVTDCPRLFTLMRTREGAMSAVSLRVHYELTLWCEHPGYEHPWQPATYELSPRKHWAAQIAPYARIALRTLQLAFPVAAALETAVLPAAARDDARVRLDLMQSLVDDLPAGDSGQFVWSDDLPRQLGSAGERRAAGGQDHSGSLPRMTPAEGQALRAVRQMIFEQDPSRSFGDMRRVQSPSGDILWVCTIHYPTYDPGLPALR